jgi:hypothetical protein
VRGSDGTPLPLLTVLRRVRSSRNACVASDGCGGILAGDWIADWLSQQNSHSLLSTGVISGLLFVVRGAGVGGGFGGDDVGSSSRITVALPSREVVRRTADEERRRRRGGGNGLAEFVRRGLEEERIGGGGGKVGCCSGVPEPFSTSCRRRWAEVVIFVSCVAVVFVVVDVAVVAAAAVMAVCVVYVNVVCCDFDSLINCF